MKPSFMKASVLQAQVNAEHKWEQPTVLQGVSLCHWVQELMSSSTYTYKNCELAGVSQL